MKQGKSVGGCTEAIIGAAAEAGYTTLVEFEADLALMIRNCRQFDAGDYYLEQAAALETCAYFIAWYFAATTRALAGDVDWRE